MHRSGFPLFPTPARPVEGGGINLWRKLRWRWLGLKEAATDFFHVASQLSKTQFLPIDTMYIYDYKINPKKQIFEVFKLFLLPEHNLVLF
jgi:hypothetical protein